MKVICRIGLHPEGRTAYHAFFSSIKPSFIGSRIFFSATEQLELVDQYDVGGSKAHLPPSRPGQYLYFINPPGTACRRRSTSCWKDEEVAQHCPNPSVPGHHAGPKYFRKVQATIADLALRTTSSSRLRKGGFGSIVARLPSATASWKCVVGPPRDRRLHRLPLGDKPIYLVHGKYGQCQTNVIFPTKKPAASSRASGPYRGAVDEPTILTSIWRTCRRASPSSENPSHWTASRLPCGCTSRRRGPWRSSSTEKRSVHSPPACCTYLLTPRPPC